jgi:hypothetical protein
MVDEARSSYLVLAAVCNDAGDDVLGEALPSQVASGLRSCAAPDDDVLGAVGLCVQRAESVLYKLGRDARSSELVADARVTGTSLGERACTRFGVAPIVREPGPEERLDRLVALFTLETLLGEAASELGRAPVAVAKRAERRIQRALGRRPARREPPVRHP